MSGVLGLWHRDGRPVESALLARLNDTLKHRGKDGPGQWIDGAVGLACQQFRVTPESAHEVQPATGPSGTVLVFDGRLDNRTELISLVGGLSASAPDAAIVLAAYEKFGDRCPEYLNGDFAFGLFDPRRQRLLLARDAIGVRPLYYARAGSTFAFASEIKAVLACPGVATQPNDAMLAGHLFRRLQLQPDRGETFFDAVSSVPPGHRVVITPDRVEVAPHWQFDAGRSVRFSRFEAYAEAFRELFQQAVRRRLRSAHPVAVSVSGGVDSSSVFCFAHRFGQAEPGLGRVVGVSSVGAASPEADESAFVADVERFCNTTITRFARVPRGVVSSAREQVSVVEAPMLDFQWGVTQSVLGATQASGARVLLTGHWGDQVLFDQAYLVDLVGRFKWLQVWRHLSEYPKWYTDSTPRDFQRRFLADVVRWYLPGVVPVLRALGRLPGSHPGRGEWYADRLRAYPATRQSPDRAWPTARARSLHLDIACKYHVLCLEWNNKVAASLGLEMAFPFLDRDLVSFMLAVPGEVASHAGVPKALLRAAGRGIVPETITGRRWKADFSTLVNAGVRDDYTELARLLGGNSLACQRGYVAQPAVERELTQARDGLDGQTCDVSWALHDLLGFESWLALYSGGQRTDGG